MHLQRSVKGYKITITFTIKERNVSFRAKRDNIFLGLAIQ